MVVCKFFQQGYCRFGQSCRFEHVYGSKYSYHAPQPAPQSAPPPSQIAVTDEHLVHQVQVDVQSVLKGKQWYLSCYAPFKEKPCLPGLIDLSPEEYRLFIYEAKANNNVDQAVAHMNNLCKEMRSKYEQLVQPTPSMVKILRSLYNGEIVSSPFGNTAQNTFASANNASSVFRSALQNQNASVFNQNQSMNPSVFQQNNGASQNIFAQANAQVNAQAKNVFAGAAQSVFSQPNPTPVNIFAQASQQYFNQPAPQQTSPFANVFKPAENPPMNTFQKSENPPANIFQTTNTTPTNIFGQANVFAQTNTIDLGLYTKMEDLSPEDLDAFKNDHFKMGFVPEVPPPQELCN